MNVDEEENNASGAAAPALQDEAPLGANSAGAGDGPSPFKKRRIEEVGIVFVFVVLESPSISSKDLQGSLPPRSRGPSAKRLPLPAPRFLLFFNH
jgi:hypothetical protein